MKPLIKISLINLQLFCISILCLFFLVIAKSGASHDLDTGSALQFFLGFVLLHLLIIGIWLYKYKAKRFDVLVACLEVLILYGLLVWDFSS
jgi:hypothetical protein